LFAAESRVHGNGRGWDLYEHDVIAGAPAMGNGLEITGRLVAPR
jgi:hypothetical protein